MATPSLALRLFGTLRVAVDGTPVAGFRTDKVRALLAYLAVEADRPHARSTLAGLLWPDMPEDTALRNLRKTLHRLHQTLDVAIGAGRDAPLLSTRQTIQLNRDVWTVDVATFRQLLGTVAAHQHQLLSLCLPCLDALTRAAALYSDELLAGFGLPDAEPFEEWLLLEREMLLHGALQALFDLAAAHLARQEYEPAYVCAARQIELDPGREEAHQQALRALALNGQHSEALASFERYRRTLLEMFGVEPSGESVALADQIRQGTIMPAVQTVPPPEVSGALHLTNLPTHLTPFVGRESELLHLAAYLRDSDYRLVSILGPGGVGKTRLALQVASDMGEHFPDGVAFVPLAPLADAALVLSRVAQTLGVQESGGQGLSEALQQALRERRLLLVLDNCEHVLDGVAEAAALREACPHLVVLATSRAPLRVRGEQEYPVSPLAVPTLERHLTVEEAAQSPAVCLFVNRARAASPTFALTEQNAAAVAAICGRLDGLPLALELAAPRVKLLSPSTLLMRLRQTLPLLIGGGRDAPERQQTLRNTIDWSYSLLPPADQTFLARLSVFVGGCTFKAAEGVCNPDGELDVLESLTGLVDQSLLRQQGEDEQRFGMLETIREYALERLAASGEQDALRRRHASWYLKLADAAAIELQGPQRTEALRRLDREHDNLRAALQWLEESGEVELGLQLAIVLTPFWKIRGHLTEGERWLTELLAMEAAIAPRQQATALLKMGELVFAQGRQRDAASLFEQSLALQREHGDLEGSSEVLGQLADTLRQQGDDERSVALLTTYVTLGRERGDQALLAVALSRLALRAAMREDTRQARSLAEECLALFRELGNGRGMCNALEIVAVAAYREGDVARGRAMIEEIIELLPQSSLDQEAIAWNEDLAWAARDQGDYAHATHWLEVRAAWARELGDRRYAAHVCVVLGILAREQGDYERAQVLMEESLTVFRETDDLRGIGRALVGLSDIARDQGNAAGVLEPGRQALTLFRETGNASYTGIVLHNLGLAARFQGDHARAEVLLAESLSVLRQSASSKGGIAEVLTDVGIVALEQGKHEDAHQALIASLRTASTYMAPTALEGLGGVATEQGQPERAGRLFGAAAAIRARTGVPVLPANQRLYQRHVTQTQEALEVDGWTRTWEEGRAMTRDEAVAYALQSEAASSDRPMERSLNTMAPSRLIFRTPNG